MEKSEKNLRGSPELIEVKASDRGFAALLEWLRDNKVILFVFLFHILSYTVGFCTFGARMQRRV